MVIIMLRVNGVMICVLDYWYGFFDYERVIENKVSLGVKRVYLI